MTLGNFIKHIRKEYSMSQEKLGECCMRSKDWCYLIENESNKTSIFPEDLLYLYNATGDSMVKYVFVGMIFEKYLDLIKNEHDKLN